MQIAVTTPTGQVGRQVVAQLIRAGVRPRVLGRHVHDLPVELAAEVDAVHCDQFEAADVTAATGDLDALFWVDPTPSSRDPHADYARATAALVRAIGQNHIPRVVFLSSVGAELRHGAGEIDGLAATELALDASDADVVQLRCAYFVTNLMLDLDAIRGGVLSVIMPVDQPMAWVTPRDVAEVAVGRLLNSDWSGHLVQAVHGPADLSWANAAAIVAAATGRPLRVERISDDAMRRRLASAGMSDVQVEAVMGMSVGLRDGFVPEQPRTMISTTPTTLAGWAYDELRPLLEA